MSGIRCEKSVNCQACGEEHQETSLKIVRLSSFGTISICDKCHGRTVENSLKSAADILEEIAFIAKATSSNPERRLIEIKNLLGK